jgi:hypothetical protein
MNEAHLAQVHQLGAKVEIKNAGHHWVIERGLVRIDYWPSSQKFQMTVKSEVRRGFHEMLELLKFAPKRMGS